jgi:folate-binding protein YgfZ
VARVDPLGVPGYVVYLDPARAADLERALVLRGAPVVLHSELDAARVEAGYPLFGIDMNHDTIPLEAGIEQRAISFTKGCYVGQEVIIRVLHRGHGRVAKRLVGLRMDHDGVTRTARIHAADRDIGEVTSAATSPTLGAVALGYVHRDFVEPGTRVTVDGPSGPVGAVVSARPIS